MATLRILAKQSRLQGATDNTHYGEGRASSKAFLTHHVANISTAIQLADADSVLNAASHRFLRQSVAGLRLSNPPPRVPECAVRQCRSVVSVTGLFIEKVVRARSTYRSTDS